jgi:hypothetical protein
MQQLLLAEDLFQPILEGQKCLTIRKGIRPIERGPLFFISPTNSDDWVLVNVYDVIFKHFQDLTQADAQQEGVPDLYTLKQGMLRFYPDLIPTTDVTLVFFTYVECSASKVPPIPYAEPLLTSDTVPEELAEEPASLTRTPMKRPGIFYRIVRSKVASQLMETHGYDRRRALREADLLHSETIDHAATETHLSEFPQSALGDGKIIQWIIDHKDQILALVKFLVELITAVA